MVSVTAAITESTAHVHHEVFAWSWATLCGAHICEHHLDSSGMLMLLQYFGHLMRRTDSLEKTLMLGKMEGGRRRG